MDVLPLTAPALLIVVSAVVVTLRERRSRDVIIDLTDDADVPIVRLADREDRVVRARPQPPAHGRIVVRRRGTPLVGRR